MVIPKERWSDWTGKGGGGTLVTDADIYPGVRPGVPYAIPANQSLELMFNPEVLRRAVDLFDSGRQDALYWAATKGYTSSA